ncbi:MAG: YeeE/YedE family protein, partial [Massilia sp.]
MNIDWLHFTPWASLAGGILIGLATALLLLANGRVAGISGILGGLLRPAVASRGDIAWRVTFILGLFVAPLAWLTMGAMPPAQI